MYTNVQECVTRTKKRLNYADLKKGLNACIKSKCLTILEHFNGSGVIFMRKGFSEIKWGREVDSSKHFIFVANASPN